MSNYDLVIEAVSEKLAHAIALAEGFAALGSLPGRIHNPGDMELGDRGWGVEQKKTVYLKADWAADLHDKTDGCAALRRECVAILIGASTSFTPSMTIEELAARWTGGDNPGAWCRIVAENLNVDPMTRLVDLVKNAQTQTEAT